MDKFDEQCQTMKSTLGTNMFHLFDAIDARDWGKVMVICRLLRQQTEMADEIASRMIASKS